MSTGANLSRNNYKLSKIIKHNSPRQGAARYLISRRTEYGGMHKWRHPCLTGSGYGCGMTFRRRSFPGALLRTTDKHAGDGVFAEVTFKYSVTSVVMCRLVDTLESPPPTPAKVLPLFPTMASSAYNGDLLKTPKSTEHHTISLCHGVY